MPSGRKHCISSSQSTVPMIGGSVPSSRRHRSLQDNPPLQPPQPFVCGVCHFSALDASGLRQHLSVSPHCSMSVRFSSPRPPSESIHGFPPMDVNNNDFSDYYDNNNGMADEDSSSGKGVAHGFVMAFVMKRPMTQQELDATMKRERKQWTW